MSLAKLLKLCLFILLSTSTTISSAKDFSSLSVSADIIPLVPIVNDPTPSLLPRVPAPENANLFADPSNNVNFVTNNATFSIEFVAAGGTDKWGEPCYTFPANAQAAYTAAANIWSGILQSSVPITIKACWAEFAGSTLGYSGGGTLHHNFAGAPNSNTVYPASLANSFAGYDLDTNNEDMHLTFNRSFNWYYGIDGNTPSDKHDLMSVVLHEIGHGLGFSGSAGYSGGSGDWGYGINEPNIYDTFIKDGGGTPMTQTSTYPNPSTTLGSLLTSNDVWFTGTNAKAANNGTDVKIYAPSSWSGGSSYSHLDYATFNNTSNQLMVYAMSTGESIHDPGDVGKGLLKDLGWGISGSVSTPAKATLVSPSGSITDNTPTYTWNAVSNASSYRLQVDDSTGNKILKWYTAAQAGCSSGTGTCSVTPTTTLANGPAKWWIRTWNSAGNGPWSATKNFTVNAINTPAKATLVSPSGNTSNNMPTYTWNAVSNATWYYLWVDDSSAGNTKFKKWYSATQAGCSSGTGSCSVTPTTALANGAGKWWIRTWNAAGNGPWSNASNFTIVAGKPPKATLVSPSGNITDNTPTYTWNAVSNSTWYYLWVSDSTSAQKIKKWYTAAQAGCSGGTGTCSVTPTTPLANGTGKWWIQTWNSSGLGPWSSAKNFNLQ